MVNFQISQHCTKFDLFTGSFFFKYRNTSLWSKSLPKFMIWDRSMYSLRRPTCGGGGRETGAWHRSVRGDLATASV